MLPEKYARMAAKILGLILAAVLSFVLLSTVIPKTDFVQESLESVEESSNTVMKFSAATLSTSLAISALPDDFATPLASSLADMNSYFVVILVVLFLEKILLWHGVTAAFKILIPLACCAGILFVVTRKDFLRRLAFRLMALGLAAAFVVPCSTHITNFAAASLTAYVDETIRETEEGAGKLNEAMEGGTEDQTFLDKLSDLLQTAIQGVSDLMVHFQNTIRRCMNAIAILILTNCLMPLFTCLIFKWILEGIFRITIPAPVIKRHRRTGPEAEDDAEPERVTAGRKEP